MANTPKPLADLVAQYHAEIAAQAAPLASAGLPAIDAAAAYQATDELNAQILRRIKGDLWCDVCMGRGMVAPSTYCTNPTCPAARDIKRRRLLIMMQGFGNIPPIYSDFSFDSWAALPKLFKGEKQLGEAVLRYFAANPLKDFTIAQVLQSPFGRAVLPELESVTVVPPNYHSKAPADHVERVEITQRIKGAAQSFTVMNSLGASVVLSGDKGVGKTGLSVATAFALIDAGYAVAYVHLPTLLEAVKATYRDGYEGKPLNDIVRPLQDSEVLIIDEFGLTGGQEASPHDMRFVENYITSPRWGAGSAKPLLITTNHTQQSFAAQWGELAASRIFEMAHWIPLSGSVIRRRNQPIA